MNPEQRYTASFGPPDNNNQSRRRLFFIAVAAAIVLLSVWVLFGLGGHKPKAQTSGGGGAAKFSITETVPLLKRITTHTQSLQIVFSQPLATKSISITSKPSIIASSDVSGQSLILNLTPNTLVSSQTYTITITSISDTAGKQLTNQKLSFSPAFSAPNFTGESGLYDSGLTTEQVSALNGYFSQFNLWAATVAIDPPTVDHHRDNPDDPWSPWDISFTVSIDGTSYSAVTSYFTTSDIQLKLFDPATGSQVFIAGNPGSI